MSKKKKVTGAIPETNYVLAQVEVAGDLDKAIDVARKLASIGLWSAVISIIDGGYEVRTQRPGSGPEIRPKGSVQ